jgi:hypothetical protein
MAKKIEKEVVVTKLKEKKKVSKEIKKATTEVNIDDIRTMLEVDIAGTKLSGEFRTFSSGSKGWYVTGKALIDGVRCQVGCNIIVIGSKPEKKEK